MFYPIAYITKLYLFILLQWNSVNILLGVQNSIFALINEIQIQPKWNRQEHNIRTERIFDSRLLMYNKLF